MRLDIKFMFVLICSVLCSALLLTPSSSDMVHMLTSSNYMDLGKELVSELSESKKDSLPTIISITQFYNKNGNYKQALSYLERYEEKYPHNNDFLQVKYICNRADMNVDGMISTLEQMHHNEAGNKDIILELLSLYDLSHSYDKKKELMKTALTLGHLNNSHMQHMVSLYLNERNFSDAYTVLDRYIDDYPTDNYVIEKIKDIHILHHIEIDQTLFNKVINSISLHSSESLMNVAQILNKNKMYNDLNHIYDILIQSPKGQKQLYELSNYYLSTAEKEGLKITKRLLKNKPSHVPYMEQEISFYAMLNRHEEALKALKALHKQSSFRDLYFSLAKYYPDESLEATAKNSYFQQNNNDMAAFFLANAYERLKDLEKSDSYLEQLYPKHKEDYSYIQHYTQVLASLEKKQQLESRLKQALEKWPDDTTLRLQLIDAYVWNENYENAIKCLQPILDNKELFKTAETNAMIALLSIKDKLKAYKYSETIEQMHPQNRNVAFTYLELANSNNQQNSRIDTKLLWLEAQPLTDAEKERLGKYYVAKGEGEKGRHLLEESYAKSDQNLSVSISLIEAYIHDHLYDKALFLVDRSLKKEPNNEALLFIRGRLALLLSQKASPHFKKYLSTIKPSTNDYAIYKQAYALHHSHNSEKAIAILKNSDSFLHKELLSELYLELGQADAALALAATMNPRPFNIEYRAWLLKKNWPKTIWALEQYMAQTGLKNPYVGLDYCQALIKGGQWKKAHSTIKRYLNKDGFPLFFYRELKNIYLDSRRKVGHLTEAYTNEKSENQETLRDTVLKSRYFINSDTAVAFEAAFIQSELKQAQPIHLTLLSVKGLKPAFTLEKHSGTGTNLELETTIHTVEFGASFAFNVLERSQVSFFNQSITKDSAKIHFSKSFSQQLSTFGMLSRNRFKDGAETWGSQESAEFSLYYNLFSRNESTRYLDYLTASVSLEGSRYDALKEHELTSFFDSDYMASSIGLHSQWSWHRKHLLELSVVVMKEFDGDTFSSQQLTYSYQKNLDTRFFLRYHRGNLKTAASTNFNYNQWTLGTSIDF